MKKTFGMFIVLILLAGVASAKNLSAWLLGDGDSLMARVGYNTTVNTEVGLESCWFKLDDSPQVWGAYGLYKFTDIIQIPNPLPLEWLPKTLNGTPYIGMQVGLNLNSKGTFVGPVAGITIQDILVIEYQYTNFDWQLENSGVDSHKIMMGFLFKF